MVWAGSEQAVVERRLGMVGGSAPSLNKGGFISRQSPVLLAMAQEPDLPAKPAPEKLNIEQNLGENRPTREPQGPERTEHSPILGTLP